MRAGRRIVAKASRARRACSSQSLIARCGSSGARRVLVAGALQASHIGTGGGSGSCRVKSRKAVQRLSFN